MARLYRRHVRGSVAAAIGGFILAVVLWPLDRAHYAFLTSSHAYVGPYFPTGQITRRSLTEVRYVVDACFEDDDGDIRRLWRLEFSDGQKLDLTSNFRTLSNIERDLVLDVAESLREEGVSFRGRFDPNQCDASLTKLSENDRRFFRELYRHRFAETPGTKR